jgi:perosamine synthetase
MNNINLINFIKKQFGDSNFIPLHEPKFIGNEKEYINNAIDSTFVSSVGQYVDKFELMLASLTETTKSVAVVNGTSALQVALRLVGVEKGDEVITQGLTFIATANAIKYNEAIPIFLDVDLDTMGLSSIAVENFLEEFCEIRDNKCYNKKSGRKISACLPMHTFGFPIKFDELDLVCKKWKIPIVEDAAESLGSLYKGKPTGSLGDIGIFSFNGNKIITSGGGGALVSLNDNLMIKAKHLTTTAKIPHAFEYIHDEIGYNFRMPNLNAALACAQLESLNLFLSNKRILAEEYNDFCIKNGIKFRNETIDTKANYWLMCIEMENRKERDLFLNETKNKNIMTRPIWQLLFRSKIYENCQRDSQMNAIYLEDRIVNIPSSVRY